MVKSAKDLEIGDRFVGGSGDWRIVRSISFRFMCVLIRDEREILHLYLHDDLVAVKDI
ncbi:hypothetical protein PP742_gp54 [Alcaligenes phage vB_Af_QDWS595]|uniref:Uncharacterized protein n=1 Tax=Alcaligenes phage vB_Af_QDWS595 TaxID=2877946 RepID=A0AAE9BZU8_9CAUD|nr:hypothetical protein PP742_gp54 [Alcaligenes phage vB_Af_QDWS595]UCR75538.1 hypothetical protein vBAfaPQDWS595_54 [Alcaligenes phage vB_Af_QDWS595]